MNEFDVKLRVHRDGSVYFQEVVVRVEAEDARQAIALATNKATEEAHAADDQHLVSAVTAHGLIQVDSPPQERVA